MAGPRVAIIDGFSSGKYVAKHLHEAGCTLIHVASKADYADYYYRHFIREIYTELVGHSNLESTIAALSSFKPDYILAGCETGVTLSDQLNRHFNLSYANDFGNTRCRRNKFDMIDALHQHGIPAAKQCKVADWQALEAWLATHQRYPVVLKPVDSAGSDGVYICKNLEECHRAFLRIKGQTNKMYLVNEFVLVQEFLHGTEYVVNTVSRDGKALLTEIVQYKKRILENGSVVYDVDQLLPADHPVAAPLFAYIQQVHKALGIYNGPAHAEVMFTETGPKLVEIAARTDGILRPVVCEKTTQLGQLKAFALSVTDPKQFFALCDKGGYQLANYSYNVCLIAPVEGRFESQRFQRELEALPSYHAADYYIKDGETAKETHDVFSQPGTVYLIHPDSSVLQQDCEKIRSMEADKVYLTAVEADKSLLMKI